MGFLAIAVSNGIRSCLPIAITEMVIPLNYTRVENHSYICLVDSPSMEQTHQISEENSVSCEVNSL